MKEIKTWEQVKEERKQLIRWLESRDIVLLFDEGNTIDEYLSRLQTVIDIEEGKIPLDIEAFRKLPGCERREEYYLFDSMEKNLERKEIPYSGGPHTLKHKQRDIAAYVAQASADVSDNWGAYIVGDRKNYVRPLFERLSEETDMLQHYRLYSQREDERGTFFTLDGDTEFQVRSFKQEASNLSQVIIHGGTVGNICKGIKRLGKYVRDLKLRAHFGGATKGGELGCRLGVLYEA